MICAAIISATLSAETLFAAIVSVTAIRREGPLRGDKPGDLDFGEGLRDGDILLGE